MKREILSTSEVNLKVSFYSYQPCHFVSCASQSPHATALLWLQRWNWTQWVSVYICRAEKLYLWIPANVMMTTQMSHCGSLYSAKWTSLSYNCYCLITLFSQRCKPKSFVDSQNKHVQQFQKVNKTSYKVAYVYTTIHPLLSIYIYLLFVGKFKQGSQMEFLIAPPFFFCKHKNIIHVLPQLPVT